MADDEPVVSGRGNGRKSQLILTLDHDTFDLVIGGSIQNFDVALVICRMAADELERKINQAKRVVSLASPPPFNLPKGVRQ